MGYCNRYITFEQLLIYFISYSLSFLGFNQSTFDFIDNKQFLCDLGPECKPIDVYNCFICDDIIKIIVIETNRQALKYKRN